jgi:hypothetical protein
MPEHYLSDFQQKRLNEVVIPGSHDAGIYGNGWSNIVTQNLDIDGQAMAGVRFFDLRIASEKKGVVNPKIEQRAYHLKQGLVMGKKSENQNVSHLGGWGDTLTSMLKQAKQFVTTHPNEFLILKFSKSYNLDNVVATCLEVLGDKQFNPRTTVNLNMLKVSQLAGKVITLFAEKDLAALKLNNYDHRYSGLIPFRELYDEETGRSRIYERFYNGFQYFGKFSSTGDISENTAKQRALIEMGAIGADRDAVGMMYWTTTGMFKSIKKRNNKMWSMGNVVSLQKTWEDGLQQAIISQMGRDFQKGVRDRIGIQRWPGGIWKAYMPNIVMMDFADEDKCNTVYALNAVANEHIAQFIYDFGHAFEPE